MAHVLLVDDFMCAMCCLRPIIIQIAIVCPYTTSGSQEAPDLDHLNVTPTRANHSQFTASRKPSGQAKQSGCTVAVLLQLPIPSVHIPLVHSND